MLGELQMKIVPGVSYHIFGENEEKVYVHSVDNNHDYIFGGIAPDVLNFFSEHDDATFEELCTYLLS